MLFTSLLENNAELIPLNAHDPTPSATINILLLLYQASSPPVAFLAIAGSFIEIDLNSNSILEFLKIYIKISKRVKFIIIYLNYLIHPIHI